MLTRFYKAGQLYTKDTELSLKYIEIDDSEYDKYDDLVGSVFCLLPESDPKKCSVNCKCVKIKTIVEPIVPVVQKPNPRRKSK